LGLLIFLFPLRACWQKIKNFKQSEMGLGSIILKFESEPAMINQFKVPKTKLIGALGWV